MKINSIITYENVFICNVSREGASDRTVESLPLGFLKKGGSVRGNRRFPGVGSLEKGRGRRGNLGFPTKGGSVRGNHWFPGVGSLERGGSVRGNRRFPGLRIIIWIVAYFHSTIFSGRFLIILWIMNTRVFGIFQ